MFSLVFVKSIGDQLTGFWSLKISRLFACKSFLIYQKLYGFAQGRHSNILNVEYEVEHSFEREELLHVLYLK